MEKIKTVKPLFSNVAYVEEALSTDALACLTSCYSRKIGRCRI
jgi:hypothetical protein